MELYIPFRYNQPTVKDIYYQKYFKNIKLDYLADFENEKPKFDNKNFNYLREIILNDTKINTKHYHVLSFYEHPNPIRTKGKTNYAAVSCEYIFPKYKGVLAQAIFEKSNILDKIKTNNEKSIYYVSNKIHNFQTYEIYAQHLDFSIKIYLKNIIKMVHKRLKENNISFNDENLNYYANFAIGTCHTTAIYLALYYYYLGLEVTNDLVFIGILDKEGNIEPVGSLREKLEECIRLKMRKIYVPSESYISNGDIDFLISDIIEFIPKEKLILVNNIEELIKLVDKEIIINKEKTKDIDKK